MGVAVSLQGPAELAVAAVPQVTLWELVWAVSQVADNEREVIATVAHMLHSGSVQLCGNFRDCTLRVG